MKRNPIQISNQLKEEFANYIASTYVVDDMDYQSQINEELKTVDLFNGPFLNTSLPFQKGDNISSLVEKDVLSKEFMRLQTLDKNRPLYKHQIDSILKAKKGRNLVITTGTGSGKTESFLYPVINYIMSLIEDGRKETGVKAIFLYPMNALVNDQKERIRDLLRDYPQITFGSFTGDTPYKRTSKALADLGIYDESTILENELISREEIRRNPPDILFTNYSMLEYLLIRPEDYSIINPNMMKQWQYMVLDEAHTYKGSLGMELSFLMRRLTGLVDKKPQFILTSATLGDKDNVEDITRFASNLTSSVYESDDVIFSQREYLNRKNITYSIDPELYVQLFKNIKDLSEVKNVCKRYQNVDECTDVEECLYKLLIHDENVYFLYDMIGHTNTYSEIKKKVQSRLKINDKQLVLLIQLISLANYKGNTIFDAKFHMFISTPDRAFITLGKDKKIRFGNYETINGNKAFEIGACKNCNHMYIVGNIEDGYLKADDSVDVYENYEESMNRKLDFFVLDNEDEYDNLQHYKVCSKCGKIFLCDDLNAQPCECGKEYLVDIYRVNNDKSSVQNNLTQCVHCGHQNTHGILRSFYLNKDSATAVLAQIYYEAMGESNESNENKQPVLTDLFTLNESSTNERNVKQLLAFSDSRQQASFFSTFFDYNQERFLNRRLVWEELKKDKEIPVKTLASRLISKIKENELFELEGTSAQSKAWVAILRDVLVVDGQYNSEGIGLYYYRYDYSDKIPSLRQNAAAIKQLFNLEVEEFMTLIDVAVMMFRKNSAIDYQLAELSIQEKKDAFQYTDQEKFIALKKIEGESSYKKRFIVSFIPFNQKVPNTITSYIMKVCECSLSQAIELAEKLFALMMNLGLFKQQMLEGMNVYQLILENFVVEPYTSKKWYVCSKCKKITVNNIHNKCPDKECNGTLEECDVDQIFTNNYYRNQYKSKEIEGISISEHTAQLSRNKGREIQKKFKDKELNILSCSTTFEMGVDIGSLENVFLRNVPPTPANYVQRAGRAGRSKDASALIVTYCTNTSHDYSYFVNPIEMIEGVVNPPQFDIRNEKIAIRHILASAFGFFFRENPEYSKNVTKLIYDDSMKEFLDYLKSKPEDLGNYIDSKVIYSDGFSRYRHFGWLEDILYDKSRLMLFIGEMVDRIALYREATEKAKEDNDFNLAKYFIGQVEQMEKESVISTLSKYAVIPKYGFPVDVVSLNVMDQIGKNNEYNLQRDLSYAISEYAPESEVSVDKKKYVSRYINTPKKNAGSLPRYYYEICPHCGQMVLSFTPNESVTCDNCEHEVDVSHNYFVIPELGFSTDAKAKKSRSVRPKKTYAGGINYVGGGIKEDTVFTYKDKVKISMYNNDKLLILNEHHFFYCPECGYTKIIDRSFAHSFTDKRSHYNALGYSCSNKKLERVSLGHIFQTDVIKMEINGDFNEAELITTIYAILTGMSNVLQIERNDINGLICRNQTFQYEMILYDNVPGGAGHVKRLANEMVFRKVLLAALNIVSQDCCDDETTCNKCLRTYYNQRYHKVMKKKYAKTVLHYLLDD